jgi:hypothetical protein
MAGGLAAAALAAHLKLGELIPVFPEPIKEPEFISRFDVLYGWGSLHADCVVRILG